jgi:hypothetical protein
MFLSRDGGVTFEQVGDLPPDESFLLGFVGDEVLIETLSPSPMANPTVRRFLFPSMQELTPPPNVQDAWPWPNGNGGTWWENDSGYYDEGGKLVVAAGAFVLRLTPLPYGFLAEWRTPGANEAYLGVFDASAALQRVFRIHDATIATRSLL